MAFSSTSRVLLNGPRNYAMLLTGISDGTGQETLVTKVDVSTMVPRPIAVKVTEIEFSINGGAVELFWDANTPVKFAELTNVGEIDFFFGGGVTNDALGKTGNIKLSTVNFTAGSTYHLRIKMVKKY